MKKISHLVVDTTGFIRNTQIQELSDSVYTTPTVIREVTSKSQLRRLVVLPYDLNVKEPDSTYISKVSEFAKLTGDYGSLSATDIQVMALTYQLENQHVGNDHLRSQPAQNIQIEPNGLPSKDLKEVVGFYLPTKAAKTNEDDTEAPNNGSNTITLSEIDKLNLNSEHTEGLNTNCEDAEDLNPISEDTKDFKPISEDTEDLNSHVEDTDDINQEEYDSGNENNEDDLDDADDDDGWITPSNIKTMKAKISSEVENEEPPVVACLTTDFAMQNVLKRIGLNVVTVDGKAIKELRTFILRCYACYKTTSVMSKVFCPNCGNKTLKKVAVSTNSDGSQQIHINFRRPLTARGKRFSLPTPKGGKHANNPILCEDQPMPQQRASKASREKNNPLDDDYTAGFSPFIVRDVTSRSAMLGIRPNAQVKQYMRRNPNESVKPGGRKRK